MSSVSLEKEAWQGELFSNKNKIELLLNAIYYKGQYLSMCNETVGQTLFVFHHSVVKH